MIDTWHGDHDTAYQGIRYLVSNGKLKTLGRKSNDPDLQNSRVERDVRLTQEELQQLAKTIATTRKRAGMTQRQLAEAMGTHDANIARLESGRHAPSIRHLQKFARVTDTMLQIAFPPNSQRIRKASHTMTNKLLRPGVHTDRRHFLGGTVSFAGLLGLGKMNHAAAEEATATAQEDVIEIPADPQRVVALDEYAAMNVLALGIKPMVVYGSFNAQIIQHILTSLDIKVVEATVVSGIDFEAIIIEQPDLVVMSNEPGYASPENYELLSEIAPTVLLPLQEPWRDTIQATAAFFDRQDEGDRLIGRFEESINELAASVQENPRSISVLGNILEMLFAVSSKAPLSGLIEEVGFTRPVAQAEGIPFEGFESVMIFSPELLREHDADVVVVFSGNDYNAEAVTSLLTFKSLPAVVEGRSFEVDGGMWFGNFPFAVYWILDDLAALSIDAGQEHIGNGDSATDRWAGFQAMIE